MSPLRPGAGIGGLAKGEKGALLGGTAGAAGGYAYHRMTQDRNDSSARRTKSRTAKVVGASALAGGATDGLIGGKKGAAVGGVGGYLLDKKMKKNPPSNQ